MMLFKKEGKKTDPPPKEIDIYKISLSALDASIPSEKRPEVAKKIKSDLLSIEIGQDKVNIPNIETPQIGIEVNLGNISALEEQYAKDPFTLARLYISHMGLLATARMKGDVPDFEQNFLGLVRK